MGQKVIDGCMIGRAKLLIFGQAATVEIMDFHIKTACTFGDGLSDPSHADNAEFLAGHLCAHQMGRPPA